MSDYHAQCYILDSLLFGRDRAVKLKGFHKTRSGPAIR